MMTAQPMPSPGDLYRTRNGRLLEVGAVWQGGVVWRDVESVATHHELQTHYTKQEGRHAAAQQ